VAIGFLLVTSLEWWSYYTDRRPQPKLFSPFALGLLAFVAWRFWRLRLRFHALHQGIEGERAVGQFLERLREDGYHVFHDLTGDGFNIDHVLIGPAGIFTIETRTWSKPVK